MSLILESNKANNRPVFFYSLSCFLSVWLIDNRFAGKSADNIEIVMKKYQFNK